MIEGNSKILTGLTKKAKWSIIVLLFLLISAIFFAVVQKYEYDYYKMCSYDYLTMTNIGISVQYKSEKIMLKRDVTDTEYNGKLNSYFILLSMEARKNLLLPPKHDKNDCITITVEHPVNVVQEFKSMRNIVVMRLYPGNENYSILEVEVKEESSKWYKSDFKFDFHLSDLYGLTENEIFQSQ